MYKMDHYSLSRISEDLAEIDGQIADVFRALSNGFQKLEKIKESSRQSRQLEDLTDKMRDCKRLIKEFDKKVKFVEGRVDRETNKMLSDKKQSMIKELNSYVAMKKQYATDIENRRVELFDGHNDAQAEENVLLASSMTSEQLIDHGHHMMDETDQAIERGKKIVYQTIDIGTETAATLKAQTEQMSRVVNELDTINFSLKRASHLVKEIGRQVATDKCILTLLFLIIMGIVAIMIIKIVNPGIKEISDISGLGPPVNNRRLLWSHTS